MKPPSDVIRRLLAEFVGTFVLVFAGTGAIATNGATGAVTHVGVALVFGLAVLVMISAVGEVSGAHLNPAVTLGFTLARRLPIPSAIGYGIAQCAAAVVASLCVRSLWPAGVPLGVTQPTLISPMACFVIELLLTGGLMLVILGVTCGTREKGLTAGLAIGGTVAMEALFAGPLTGASMNPARSLGPALVSGDLASLWIYLLAPPLGAAAAVFLNTLIRDCDCHPLRKIAAEDAI